VFSRQEQFTSILIVVANDPHLTAFDEMLPAATGRLATQRRPSSAIQPTVIDECRAKKARHLNHNHASNSVAQDGSHLLGRAVAGKARPAPAAQPPSSTTLPSRGPGQHHLLPRGPPWLKPDDLTRDSLPPENALKEVNCSASPAVVETLKTTRRSPACRSLFTSANWGSLVSFKAQAYLAPKRYGDIGNSFVAVVDFGPRIVRFVCDDSAQAELVRHAALHRPGRPILRASFMRFYPEDVKAQRRKKRTVRANNPKSSTRPRLSTAYSSFPMDIKYLSDEKANHRRFHPD
jgi:hypothetical protein